MKALLLAGGKGTRLWPLSRSHTPKQIISPFGDEKNLLQHTIERTKGLGFNSQDIFLITAQDQEKLLQPFCTDINEMIIEPEAKNTAPAILLGSKKLMELGTDEGEAIYVFPSDHYIVDFKPNLKLCLHDIILCFRIIPTRAETEYGYIQAHTGGITRKVRRFTEKPNKELAEQYYQSWVTDPEGVQEEKYFWNSGIYAFTLNSLGQALEKIDHRLYEWWKSSSYKEFANDYAKLPKTPFDKLIAEQAFNLHCAPLEASLWRDVGTWQSVYEALVTDNDKQNVHIGKGQIITTNNTSSCLISSDKDITIACVGVEDLAVIIANNNILIVDKKNPQAMQELITKLQNNHQQLI